MDEEGTVVYFETSPALQGQDRQFADECSFIEGTELPKTDTPTLDVLQPNTVLWRKLYSYAVTTIRGILPNYSGKEAECRRGIAESIRDSPLLTEEDYQLLYFVLLKPHPQQVQTEGTSLSYNSHTSKSVVVAVLVVVLAVCVYFSLTLLLSCAVCGLLLLCAGRAVTVMVHTRHERCLQAGRKAVSGYCSEAEALLSLLTHCVRTIQEAEIVSRGYSRPSRGVPVSRMEGGPASYQCVALRRRLFSVCQAVLGRLRTATLHLCQQYPLSGDLDDVSSYLAQSSLDSLHPHITTDLDTISEDLEKHICLSLESLKDAANLLAVQNSELLRRLALTLLTAAAATGDGGGERRSELPLLSLPGVLQSVRQEVGGARQDLQWSCDFHKNHLFGVLTPDPCRAATTTVSSDRALGEPPSRASAIRSDSSTAHPLSGLAREVHCMDLKTQTALQRIRDLGSQLARDRSTEETSTAIETYREQLAATHTIIDAVSDHIEDSLSILHTLQHPKFTREDEIKCEEESEAVELPTEPENYLVEPQQQDSSSSEDEMVFEAYVPAMRDSKGDRTGDVWRVEEEEGRGRDVTRGMMRELESVLAVRSNKREKQREERRRRRREQRGQPHEKQEHREDSSTRTTSFQQALDPQYSDRKENDVSAQCLEGGSTALHSVIPSNSKLKQEILEVQAREIGTATPDSKKPCNDVTLQVDESACVSMSSQLAAAVAAIAADRKKFTETTEETFGSDSSHSD